MSIQKDYLENILRKIGVQNKDFFPFFLAYFTENNGYIISPETLKKSLEHARKMSYDRFTKISGEANIEIDISLPEKGNTKKCRLLSNGTLIRNCQTYDHESLLIMLPQNISSYYNETIYLTSDEDVNKGDTHIRWISERKENEQVIERVDGTYIYSTRGAFGLIFYYNQESLQLAKTEEDQLPVPTNTEGFNPEDSVKIEDFIDMYRQFVNKNLGAILK